MRKVLFLTKLQWKYNFLQVRNSSSINNNIFPQIYKDLFLIEKIHPEFLFRLLRVAKRGCGARISHSDFPLLIVFEHPITKICGLFGNDDRALQKL